ncbi:hypothetical protein CLOP_g2778 [Closterium sp. NIES-67]|nr:hypothetical protein CLOP_g2778 [Closterium sp. NIES-67]
MAYSCLARSTCRTALSLGSPFGQRLDQRTNNLQRHESSGLTVRPVLTYKRFSVRAVAVSPSSAPDGVAGETGRAGGAPRGAKQVVLVDPVEAKRLAQEDLKRRAKAASKQKWREIEAINGAWAVIGIFAALVGEGFTQTGILGQLAIYLELVAGAIDSLAKLVGGI